MALAAVGFSVCGPKEAALDAFNLLQRALGWCKDEQLVDWYCAED
jgi:hypothetical protein